MKGFQSIWWVPWAYFTVTVAVLRCCTCCDAKAFALPQAVKNKYSSQKQMRIASISQLKSSLIKELAQQIS